MTLPRRAVYATQPAPLRKQIHDALGRASTAPSEGQLFALIVPDSNRLGGAAIAAEAYALLKGQDFDTVILVSPSHEGDFGRISICRADTYHTPLGEVPINDRLRHEFCDEDDDIYLDDAGHYHTEGVDVQLPFLQVLFPDRAFDIVPLVMGEETPAFCRELGIAVGEVMYGQQALIIATADVLQVEGAAFEDFTAVLKAFDESELLHLLGGERLKMEGMGAVIVAIIAAAHRGARRAEVLAYEPPTETEIGAFACALWRD
ncbi:MAG: AmmeMemoRadiSam system protein B [Bacteroidota bacterium]